MWWEVLPWLLFLVCLGGAVAGYRHTHRQQQRQLNELTTPTPTQTRTKRRDEAHH